MPRSNLRKEVIRGSGGGGKGGGGGARVAHEDPDSLQSRQYAKLVEVISEGEISGFADPVNPLRCVALDGTPVENADGTLNFNNFEFYFLPGTQDQSYLPGFDAAASITPVNVKVTQAASPGPWIKQFTDTLMDAVRIDIRFPRLQKQNTTNGDITGTQVQLQIWMQPSGGAYTLIVDDIITGKASNPYVRSYHIELGSITPPWNIKVVRITDDHDETQAIQDDTYIESYSEITYGKLRYPNTAVVGVWINAEQFGNIPVRAYRMKGIIVRVPLNYDPIKRAYATTGAGTSNGTWNGDWKLAWTNNPAWCYYDMATNKRYGLGNYLSDASVNKFALYPIAQYCDGLVPNGLKNGILDPAAPTVVKVGAAGTSTYKYKVVAIDSTGHWTAASPVGTVTNGNAVLSETNYNTLTWAAVAGAVSYEIYRTEIIANTSPTTLGKIGTSTAATFNDQGAAGDSAIPPTATYSGKEPRFTCSLYLQKREDAMKVLTDMTTIFRGMHYFAQGALTPIQDKPREPDIQIGPANVIGGVFAYSGTGRKARHTAALVSFNDQNNYSKLTPEPFEDGDAILKYGYNPIFITNLGCTSQMTARRAGKWALTAERILTDALAVSMGAEGFKCRPGWIAQVTDPLRDGADWSGRIVARTATSITLDLPVIFTVPGAPYWIYFTVYDPASAEGERSKVIGIAATNASGTHTVITFASQALLPDVGTMWQIGSASTDEPELFRVLGVTPRDDATVDVVLLQYNESLYAHIDDDSPLDEPGPGPLPNPNFCVPVKAVIFTDGISNAGSKVFGSTAARFDQSWLGHRLNASGNITGAEIRGVTNANSLIMSEEALVTDPTVTYEFSALGVRQITLIDPVQGASRDLHIGWLASTDRWLRGYRLAYRHDNGNWSTRAEIGGTEAVIDNVIPGRYDISVVAVNRWGKTSTPVELSVLVETVNPLAGAIISGLEITGQGNDTTFNAPDVQFNWRLNSAAMVEYIPEDDADGDPFFSHYIVTIYDIRAYIAIGTDLEIDASDATKVTSDTRDFAAMDVGNWLHITAGTGFTPGWYRIVSVAGNAATLDVSPGPVGSTGGDWTEHWTTEQEPRVIQAPVDTIRPTYTFMFQNNEACIGGPYPSFRIGVMVQDDFGNRSDEAFLDVSKLRPLKLLPPCNLIPTINGANAQWTNPVDISRDHINFYLNIIPSLPLPTGDDGLMEATAAAADTSKAIDGLHNHAYAHLWAEAEDVFGLKSTIPNDAASVLYLGIVVPGHVNDVAAVTFMPDGGLAPADNIFHLAHPDTTAQIWWRNDAVMPGNTGDGNNLYDHAVGVPVDAVGDEFTVAAYVMGLWGPPTTRVFNQNSGGGSDLEAPSFEPPGGTHRNGEGALEVNVAAPIADYIFYTMNTDGSSLADPSHDASVPPLAMGDTIRMDGAAFSLTLERGLTKIKALAQKAGVSDSTISSASYNVIRTVGLLP